MGVALAASAALAEAQQDPAVRKTRSYNEQMEYRPLGQTGIWVSAVCMGGHWKRVDQVIGGQPVDPYQSPDSTEADGFHKNRTEIVSCCIDHGINLVDACTGGEILTYSRALKGRRESIFLDFSWSVREPRNEAFRTAKALLQGFDQGLHEAGLEYADLWRVTCLEKGGRHTQAEVEELVKALDMARRQGKCRFTGISSHDRVWLKMMIETYPQQIQVILSPYTADSEVMPQDSLFESVVKHRVGFLGIKPFASNSLFKGNSAPNSPDAEEDDRRARLAIRYILSNPAITAPIPGLITPHQVENVVKAVQERRDLRQHEHAELKRAAAEMWANLPPDYEWLREWKYV
jgi:predicted aldo/keto reductase-like oxidoreductase